MKYCSTTTADQDPESNTSLFHQTLMDCSILKSMHAQFQTTHIALAPVQPKVLDPMQTRNSHVTCYPLCHAQRCIEPPHPTTDQLNMQCLYIDDPTPTDRREKKSA